MDHDQLPPLELIGVTSRDAIAAMMVGTLLQPGQGFNFGEPIIGTDRSGRVLYIEHPNREVAPFPHPMAAVEVMAEMMRIGRELRYPPHAEPTGCKKGWSFHRTTVNGVRALVIWCEWTK